MLFLHPAFLSALALAAIPLLVHLLRRRKIKVIRWAAMEFLRQSQKRQRQRLQIEELILLLLRMLIVALAAMAFARPVLRAMGIPLLAQNARVYAVIVLDNSFSMDYRDTDGKRSFDRAQAAAERIASRILKPGDAVSFVLASDKPVPVIGPPSYDLTLVRERMRAATVSDRATDYFHSAQATLTLLKASSAPAKEVYWISDDQANAWPSSKTEAARSVWQQIGLQARVTWISVGASGSQRENLAVEAPTLSNPLVTPHVPTRIESRVANFGAHPRNDVLVHLFVDGKAAGSTRLSLPAGGTATARFVTVFDHPGIHTGQIALDDPEHADGLPRDNQTSFVVRCRDRLHVLVLDAHGATNSSQNTSLYLMAAMAPFGASESLAPTLRTSEDVTGVNLRDYDVVMDTDVAHLSATDRQALSDYVRTGGGLLLFPGPNTEARTLNAELASSGLLPAQLGQKRALNGDAAPVLDPGTITHPALSLFKDTTSFNLGSAHFTTYYALEPMTNPQDANAVEVMIRFGNQDPAFVTRSVGLGRVVLAASSANTAWNELPQKPSFVPLIYQMVSYLGQGATLRRNLHQDEPFSMHLPLSDANKPVTVVDSDGSATTQNSGLDASGAFFTYPSPQRATIYRVHVPSSHTEDAFAVALPFAESDLTFADPTLNATQAGLPASHLIVATTPTQIEEAVRRSRYGAEIWRPLIWLVIPLLFLESFLAQRFGRRG